MPGFIVQKMTMLSESKIKHLNDNQRAVVTVVQRQAGPSDAINLVWLQESRRNDAAVRKRGTGSTIVAASFFAGLWVDQCSRPQTWQITPSYLSPLSDSSSSTEPCTRNPVFGQR
jgi:hypothetical protein